MRNAALRNGLVCGLATLLAGGGCLERKETIRVRADGSARIEIEIDGDSSDIGGPDALPSRAAGWIVEREDYTRNDQPRTTLRARLRLGAGEPWPDSFAPPDDPQYDAALRFPTSLTIERRRDGVYYHFHREYEPRRRAQYQYFTNRLKKFLDQMNANDKSLEELSIDERRRFVALMAENEAMKHVQFVQAGVDALGDRWPQDYGLRLKRAVRDHFMHSPRLEAIANLLGEGESQQRDEEIQRFADDTVGKTPDVLEAELAALGASPDERAEFFEAFEAEQARADATEDLADEHWVIRLELPGELVAHNGDRVEDGRVVWEFDAEALFDRRMIVAATSVVHRGSSRSP